MILNISKDFKNLMKDIGAIQFIKLWKYELDFCALYFTVYFKWNLMSEKMEKWENRANDLKMDTSSGQL